jgi:ATP-dependent protease Clp ATPase subunit
MKKILIIIAVFVLNASFAACAEESVSLEDKVIGGTFKGLAKMYVATCDVNKLKKENIAVMNKMSDEKFNKRYARVYRVIRYMPDKLKSEYGIAENMSREQVIKNINSLDKDRMYEIVDAIPDTAIANEFKRYLDRKKQDIAKSNTFEQVNRFWSDMLKKLEVSSAPSAKQQ